MSLRNWFRWIRTHSETTRPRVVRRLGLDGLTDRVTPSHGGFGFFHSFGGPWGWTAAQAGNAGGTGAAPDSTGGSTGDPGHGCGGAWGRWSGEGASDTSAAATHFDLRVGRDPHTGEATRLTVVAPDASNHPVRNYTGTVRLTSSDGAAVLPANYTFAVTLNTAGSQTVTATDPADSTTTGSVTVTVGTATATGVPGHGFGFGYGHWYHRHRG